jgi:hypothetical protein
MTMCEMLFSECSVQSVRFGEYDTREDCGGMCFYLRTTKATGKAGQDRSGQQEMVCWFLFLALALAGTCRPCRGAVSVWLKA